MGRQSVANRGATSARVGDTDDLERYRLLAEVRASWESLSGLTNDGSAPARGDLHSLPNGEARGALSSLQKGLLKAIRGADTEGLSFPEQSRLPVARSVSGETLHRARRVLESRELITNRKKGRYLRSYAIFPLDAELDDVSEPLTFLAAFGRRADWIIFRMIPRLGPAENWFDSLWALYDSMETWAQRTGILVAQARAKGATWNDIGEALGIDAESAYRRLYWLSEVSATSRGVEGEKRG